MTPSVTPRSARQAAGGSAPHLRHERLLLRGGARLVAGMDEVGRGSLAGPVSVGVVVVGPETRSAPRGVADSKLLTPAARVALLPALRRWGLARAVGHASSDEIDAIGIIAALRLAGRRALASVSQVVGPVDTVLLDGNHDWLTGQTLFDVVEDPPRVHLRIRADRSCASVAAASVLAKCERDALMVALADEHPAYRWADNKGYASPEHVAALREHGTCPQHRCSWRLPGLFDDVVLPVSEDDELLEPDDVLGAIVLGDDEPVSSERNAGKAGQ